VARERLRVGLVIGKFQQAGGGTERYVHGLAAYLLSRGADVHLLSTRCDSPLAESLTFHAVALPPGPPLVKTAAFARRVPPLLATLPLDVVCGVERLCGQHVYLATGGSHADYLAARRRAAGPLWRLHSWARPLNRLILALEGRMFADPNLRRVRVMSRRGAAELARRYGLAEGRLSVIPHGVDCARFDLRRREAARSAVRSRHGLGGSEPVAVLVGSNFELKGLGFALRAMAALKVAGGVPPRLLVLGKGSAARHRRLAERLGLGGRVVFVGLTEQAADYLLAADYFLLPSLYETFGLAILEAMAAGLPVVVSAACGAAELVAENESGFVLDDPADAGLFASRLQALADPGLRMELGERARAVAARWSWERDFAATCRLLGDVAQELTQGSAFSP